MSQSYSINTIKRFGAREMITYCLDQFIANYSGFLPALIWRPACNFMYWYQVKIQHSHHEDILWCRTLAILPSRPRFCVRTTWFFCRLYQNIIFRFSSFPGFWPAMVLFTVALTEAHLGAVQIQSCANLLVPFLSFFFTNPTPLSFPSPSIPLTCSRSFLCTSVPVDGDVKYLKLTLLFGDNALQQMGHRCTDPNVCKSPYKAAQDVFNITQVPQALF